MPGYTACDAALGVARDRNISSVGDSINTSTAQFIKSELPLRPRVITPQIGYRF